VVLFLGYLMMSSCATIPSMFYTHKFPSGLRLLTIPVKEVPSVSVLVLINVGSRYEDEKTNGLAHFTEHMLFQGNKKWESKMELGTAVDQIGAEYNGLTGKEYTGYYVKAESKNLELSLDILSQMLWHSKFEDFQIEREKGVIAEEINYREDSPQISASDSIMELIFANHPIGLSGAGEKETIQTFKRPDFLNFHKKYYHAKNTIVIIAGSFENDHASELTRQYFGNICGLEVLRPVPWQRGVANKNSGVLVSVKEKTTDQTHFCLGALSLKKTDPKRYALSILNIILGSGMSSRLFQKIREEKSLAYYIDSDTDNYIDTGIFSVSGGVNPQKLEEAIKSVIEELDLLTTVEVSKQELRKGKDYLRGKLALSLEESLDKAMFYGQSWLLEGVVRTIEEIVEGLEKVSAEDVRDVAKMIFSRGNYRLSVVGKGVDVGNLEKIIF